MPAFYENTLKEAMSVSFHQTCLTLTFKLYICSESYSCKYEKLPNIVIHAIKFLDYN